MLQRAFRSATKSTAALTPSRVSTLQTRQISTAVQSPFRLVPVLRVPGSSAPKIRSVRDASTQQQPAGKKPNLVVPVINLMDLKGTAEDKKRIAKEIDKAAREIGFFTIVGHGLDRQMIQRMWGVTQKYFDLPVEEKKKIVMTEKYPYGYSGYAEENLAAGYGKNALPDLKECFAIGPYNPIAGMPPVLYPNSPPELKKAWEDYYRGMEVLASNVLKFFALALDLPENWFEDKIDKHRSALRALNYPEQKEAPKPGQIRAGEHTDYGSITILLQDSVGGLQVKSRAGEWVDIATTPDSFVINLGDLMSRWTNDRWVSTLHRVMNTNPARRQSIAFFHNINHDHMVSCIPTCIDAQNPRKYPDILAWDHLMEKHLASTKQ